MPLVFLSPYKKSYSSEIISLSTLLGFVVLLTAILIPLFAAFATEDFWLRIKEYTEQPLVDYKEKFMIYITKYDNNNKITTTFHSSDSKLNEEFERICNDPLNHDFCNIETNAAPTTSSTDIDGDELKIK